LADSVAPVFLRISDRKDVGDNWVVGRNLEEAKKIAYAKYSKVRTLVCLTSDIWSVLGVSAVLSLQSLS
jgi:hypothetical protein